ncbi:hypothetical protein C7974DRAFT_422384 [Boeremia exigua]|uniref:uncharacterized protein n=1 Tax=Boeremia exigua TaxID=749465 RepID=UPI001E8E4BDE|nr:uncharacterized protein C7974DRAFT_422384 [Boeremia exigua]KAH6639887.1 hypothetical protein C7974DRAFT_422384 [Boeremia exigua]
MAFNSSGTITVQHITTPDALNTLCRSCDGLPNGPKDPASLYLSHNTRSLTIYIAPLRVVNVISFPYLIKAFGQEEMGASALKSLLETNAATKVFFDARETAKILFDSCSIKLALPLYVKRAHVHEVQMMEVALRPNDNEREWLLGLDECIARDSSLDIDSLMPDDLGRVKGFDKRTLHLPFLWKKYHDRLLDTGFQGGAFWTAQIREATRKRLAVACGDYHAGYNGNNAWSTWDEDSIEEQTDAWNDGVGDDDLRGIAGPAGHCL